MASDAMDDSSVQPIDRESRRPDAAVDIKALPDISIARSFQEPKEHLHSEEMLGELWLDGANSTTARSRCPSVGLLMLLSTGDATYFTFAATREDRRAPRHRINLLYSPHTILQYAHLPRQGSIGLDRGPRCLNRTNSRIMRDRHHRDSY